MRTAVPPVPAGKTYPVWVIDDGHPVSGGLFAPGTGTLAIPVDGSVGNGSVVAVTVEDEPAGKERTNGHARYIGPCARHLQRSARFDALASRVS